MEEELGGNFVIAVEELGVNGLWTTIKDVRLVVTHGSRCSVSRARHLAGAPEKCCGAGAVLTLQARVPLLHTSLRHCLYPLRRSLPPPRPSMMSSPSLTTRSCWRRGRPCRV